MQLSSEERSHSPDAQSWRPLLMCANVFHLSSMIVHNRLFPYHRILSRISLLALTCEACGRAPAKKEDILCDDCDYHYTILLELAGEHPELGINRLKEIYEWRMKKVPRALIDEATAP